LKNSTLLYQKGDGGKKKKAQHGKDCPCATFSFSTCRFFEHMAARGAMSPVSG